LYKRRYLPIVGFTDFFDRFVAEEWRLMADFQHYSPATFLQDSFRL